jgi:hypothetical protein
MVFRTGTGHNFVPLPCEESSRESKEPGKGAVFPTTISFLRVSQRAYHPTFRQLHSMIYLMTYQNSALRLQKERDEAAETDASTFPPDHHLVRSFP